MYPLDNALYLFNFSSVSIFIYLSLSALARQPIVKVIFP